ncbi:MAG: hypothetical protein ABJB74_03025 [Gemmatimonas sp.]
MQIEIDELVSRVQTVDGAQLLTTPVLQEIVRVVTANVRRELAHEQKVLRERQLGHDAQLLGGK